jgi:NAD(P)-dependent dehydrogenase (short-subunit alcohol dehydrogenase family)
MNVMVIKGLAFGTRSNYELAGNQDRNIFNSMTKTGMQEQCIVVIGGTGGMGLSAAMAFREAGANLVVTGRDELHVEEALRLLGNGSKAMVADAADEHSAGEAIRLCQESFGHFTGLYHVAGGSGRQWGDGPLHEMSLEAWQQTLRLNLDSVMISNRAAIRAFRKQGRGGAILNMSSVLGYSPSPGFFTTHAYAAAKAAIIGFSKSIAAYYAKDNIRVNVIAPSLIETPMSRRATTDARILHFLQTKQPLDGGRAGIPEDVDGAAMLLLSEAGRFITGQVIAVDGGWTVSEGQYDLVPPG